jgi:hypothetical protein
MTIVGKPVMNTLFPGKYPSSKATQPSNPSNSSPQPLHQAQAQI